MSTSLHEIYNRFADTYESNRGAFDISSILRMFYDALGKNEGELLDLGCGAGEPVARYFIGKGWRVTGVDFSGRMLELAAKYAPEMNTTESDMREIRFAPNQFDAITATYSIFHIPVEDHFDLFRNIHRWLKPEGRVLFTYATKEYTGSDRFSGYKRFIDTDLFYSHATPDELFRDLEAIGFAIDSRDYHTIGGETFLWVTTKKLTD